MDRAKIIDLILANADVFRQLAEALTTRSELTRNFTQEEFENGNKLTAEQRVNVTELAQNMQVIRDYFNSPIRITSGVRSHAQNKAARGAENSQHLTGKACDFVVVGVTPDEVVKGIEKLIEQGKIKQGGLSAYKTFTHYDTRGTRARW
jgi:uncharacterized protein YcbK (DUF882 family)